MSALSAAGHALAFYPVIAGGQVLIAGPRWVMGYDLSSGRPSGRYDLPEERLGAILADREDQIAPILPGSRFTLTVAGKHIYARLGNPAVVGANATKPQEQGGAATFLVCLDLQADPQRK